MVMREWFAQFWESLKYGHPRVSPEVTLVWDDAHGGYVRTPLGTYDLKGPTFSLALDEARTIIRRDCGLERENR